MSNAEDSDVQIAAILGIMITTIAGTFKSLFDDRFEYFTLPHLFQVNSTGLQVNLVESRWTPGTI